MTLSWRRVKVKAVLVVAVVAAAAAAVAVAVAVVVAVVVLEKGWKELKAQAELLVKIQAGRVGQARPLELE
jgi:hypothetical protein